LQKRSSLAGQDGRLTLNGSPSVQGIADLTRNFSSENVIRPQRNATAKEREKDAETFQQRDN